MTDRQSIQAEFRAGMKLHCDDQITARTVDVECGDAISIERKSDALFLHLLEGRVLIRTSNIEPVSVSPETTIAVKICDDVKLVASGPGKSNVFYFTVPRKNSFVSPLPEGILTIPPSDLPARRLLRLMVEAISIELEIGPSDHTIISRACEVMMILFVRQQLGLLYLDWAPDAIGYDRQILYALSAYFSRPHVNWTIEQLASEAGLSRSTFFNRFHEVFGAPPFETLRRIRLERAKNLMRSTNASLANISAAVGYKSETALIRAFKRAFGVTPGRWRDQRVTVEQVSR